MPDLPVTLSSRRPGAPASAVGAVGAPRAAAALDAGPGRGATWPQARELLRALSPALLQLADDLTATMFCAKDVTGRYVVVNEAFVRRTVERSRRAVVGRRAHDLFVPQLAEHYDAQDRTVLTTGRALHRELELIRRPGGSPGWYLTSKVAVRAEGDGRVLGLVSLSEDLGEDDPGDPAVMSLSRVTTLVAGRLDDPPSVGELAAAAGCSTSTLARRMRRVFALSPQQFVLRARIDHATALLTGGDLPLTDVATACGFYDQAVFTRTFGRLTGETPAQFRRAQAGRGAGGRAGSTADGPARVADRAQDDKMGT